MTIIKQKKRNLEALVEEHNASEEMRETKLNNDVLEQSLQTLTNFNKLIELATELLVATLDQEKASSECLRIKELLDVVTLTQQLEEAEAELRESRARERHAG